MHGFGHNRSQGPSWLVAVVAFVALILIVQLVRDRRPASSGLQQHFAPDPAATSTGGINLPPLPANVAGMARTAIAQISAGGAVPALTPVAQGSSLRVEISGIQSLQEGLKITGSVSNAGARPVPVSLAAFQFTDGSGTVYAAQSDTTTTLTPGQKAPLDLTLPIQDPSQLTLNIQIEGEPAIEMVLLRSQ